MNDEKSNSAWLSPSLSETTKDQAQPDLALQERGIHTSDTPYPQLQQSEGVEISTENVTPELVAGTASVKVLAKILEDGEKAQRPKSKQARNGAFSPHADAAFILACVKIAMAKLPSPPTKEDQ